MIHLGDSPHLPASIKLWNGDSRGHWEGNTLVVDVANNNSKARLARTGEFASEQVRIQERYIFDTGGERFTYQAVYTDPTVFTRPVHGHDPEPADHRRHAAGRVEQRDVSRQSSGPEPIIEAWERVCAENNGPHGDIATAP